MYCERNYEINGVSLFCKIRGEGTPLLLIHGAAVDADFFDETAKILAKNHKVITYDRRGYSRSGGEIKDSFIEDSANDGAEIIKNLFPKEKAAVIGCSAGALIAMELANKYPKLISLAVIYEPPAMAFLPEDHEAFAVADRIRAFVAEGKIGRGVTKFLLLAENGDENAKPKSEETMLREEKNMHFFIKNEFAETFKKDLPPKIPESVPAVFCAGDAHREDSIYVTTRLLAEKSNRTFIRIAGKHNCAYDLPLEFAAAMEGIIALMKD